MRLFHYSSDEEIKKNGKTVARLPKPNEIRDYVLEEIDKLALEKDISAQQL